MHNNLQIIYKHNKPYGIRDENGYLFFFTEVAKWSGQEERYRQEVQEQFALADYMLASLQARGLTKRAPDLKRAAGKSKKSTKLSVSSG